jgi:benzoyl-CoA reductase/2-hydroxyglutaryl-CoA dehydratase subunit BcrC/BadD/HgdB
VSGSIIAPGNTKIIDVLEDVGVTVVADDICTGQRTFAGFTVKEPTLAGLAEAYLDRTPCAAQLYPDQKTDKRLENIFKQIEDHRADGVLYHTLRFCDPYTFRVEENKELLDAKDIPFLQLHTDYGANDIGQIQTRIQAQVEIIRRRKKEAAHVRSQKAV